MTTHASELGGIGNILLKLALDSVIAHGAIKLLDTRLDLVRSNGLKTAGSVGDVGEDGVVSEDKDAFALVQRRWRRGTEHLLLGETSVAEQAQRDVLGNRGAPRKAHWTDSAARIKQRVFLERAGVDTPGAPLVEVGERKLSHATQIPRGDGRPSEPGRELFGTKEGVEERGGVSLAPPYRGSTRPVDGQERGRVSESPGFDRPQGTLGNQGPMPNRALPIAALWNRKNCTNPVSVIEKSDLAKSELAQCESHILTKPRRGGPWTS